MTIQRIAAEKWRWLCREGLAWVDEAAQFDQELVAMRLLRRSLNPWQLAMVLQQLSFRRRAQARFPDAQRWLWTDRSLQQASDWKSADFKAQLIPQTELIVDACCGAGADLVAFAGRAEKISKVMNTCIVGVDCDSQMVELARANLQAHGRDGEFIVGQFPDVFSQLKNCWIHVDPDRRPTDTRATRVEHFNPPLERFLPLVETAAGAIIKLAPATQLQPHFESRFQRGWIGNGGQCRQQLLIRGARVCEERFCFAVLCDRSSEPEFFCDQPHAVAPIASELKDYVFELHPVLHASSLQSAFANRHGLAAIESTNGYFTGHDPISSPWVQSFHVLDTLSLDQRKLRQWLHLRNIGIVEVKKRLVELDANRFQRELSRPAGEHISLLATRLAGRTVAIACKRLISSDLVVQ